MVKTSYGFFVWLPSTSCMIFFWFLIMSRVMIYLLTFFFLFVRFLCYCQSFSNSECIQSIRKWHFVTSFDKISNICSILFLSICSFGFAIPVYDLSRTGCFLTFCSKTAILHLHCPIYNVIEALYNKKAYIFAIFSKSTKKSDILFCENKIKQYICKRNNKTRNIVII